MSRVLVIADYGMYICHTNGRVSRFIIFSSVIQISVFGLSLMIRSLGQSDVLISLNPHRCNTSNDPQIVIDLLHSKCKDACAEYRRVDAVSYTALVKECVLTLENPVDLSPETGGGQTAAGASNATATQQLASSIVMLGRTKEREASVAATAMTASFTNGSFSSPALSVSLQQQQQRAEAKARVVELYKKHNPSKLDTVEALLNEFRGREQMLVNAIIMKYCGAENASPSTGAAHKEQLHASAVFDDDALARPALLVVEHETRVGAEAPPFPELPKPKPVGRSDEGGGGGRLRDDASPAPLVFSPTNAAQESMRSQMLSTLARGAAALQTSCRPPDDERWSREGTSQSVSPPHGTPPNSEPSPESTSPSSASMSPSQLPLVPGVEVSRSVLRRSPDVPRRDLNEQRAALGIPPRLFSPESTLRRDTAGLFLPDAQPAVPNFEEYDITPQNAKSFLDESAASIAPVPCAPLTSVDTLRRSEETPLRRTTEANDAGSILSMLRGRSQGYSTPVAVSPKAEQQLRQQELGQQQLGQQERRATVSESLASHVPSMLSSYHRLSGVLAKPLLPATRTHCETISAEELSRCAIELLARGSSATGGSTTRPSTVGFLQALRRHAQDAELMHCFKYDMSTTVKVLDVVEITGGGEVLAMPSLFLDAFSVLWMERCGYVIVVSRVGGEEQPNTVPCAPRALAEHLQRRLAVHSAQAPASAVAVWIGTCLDTAGPGLGSFVVPLHAWDAAVQEWNDMLAPQRGSGHSELTPSCASNA